MVRGTNGTRGPMQGALPDNLEIIKEIQTKRFLQLHEHTLRTKFQLRTAPFSVIFCFYGFRSLCLYGFRSTFPKLSYFTMTPTLFRFFKFSTEVSILQFWNSNKDINTTTLF